MASAVALEMTFIPAMRSVLPAPKRMPSEGGLTKRMLATLHRGIVRNVERTDDPALSVARARVTPGVTTRLHRLAGVAERYVILAGSGRVELVGPDRGLTPADHTVSDLEPGDVVVIPAGFSQRITNIGEGDLVFLALCTPRFTRAAYADCGQ